LILDSVVPHNAGYDLVPVELRAVARVLRLACRDAKCSGDPAADLAAVVRKRHDGGQVLDALTVLSIVDPTFRQISNVPEALRRPRRGAPAQLTALLIGVGRGQATPAEALSQGLHASAVCADWRFPWGDSDAPLATRAAKLARAAAKLTPGDVWPFDRMTTV